MKYLATYLLFITIVSYSSNDKNELEFTFEKYREYLENKNYSKAFDYYYPEFLKNLPKKELEKEFLKIDNNPNLELKIANSQIISISNLINYDFNKYALIKYSTETHINFSKEASSKYRKKIKEKFKNAYAENYTYLRKNKEIIIYKEQSLISIYKDKWYFIPYKEKLRPYLNIWIPESVILKLIK